MFDSFRDGDWNSYYGPQRTAATYDLSLAILITGGAIIFVLIFLVVMGMKLKERLITFMRMFFNLHPGVIIGVCMVGESWQSCSAHVHNMLYTEVQDRCVIDAHIGVQIGLNYMNITLTGFVNGSLSKRHVIYNERFSFVKVRDVRQEYSAGLTSGLPQPIIYILEYFMVDEGELRWERVIRLAGHFVFITLGFAVAFWAMANVLLAFVVVRGAVFMTMTGALMVGACVLYHTLHPGRHLIIPFESTVLKPHYDWCLWACCVSGVLTIIWGVGIIVHHHRDPVTSSRVFLLDSAHTVTPSEDTYLEWKGPLVLETPLQVRKRAYCRKNNATVHMSTEPEEESTNDVISGTRRRRPRRQSVTSSELDQSGDGRSTKVMDDDESFETICETTAYERPSADSPSDVTMGSDGAKFVAVVQIEGKC